MDDKAIGFNGMRVMLRGARDLVEDVARTWHAVGHADRAARTKSIGRQLDAEIDDLDRELAQLERGATK
jgi:hypothetical protein